MKELCSLFMRYRRITPTRQSTPFVLSELDSIECPDDVRESFPLFQEVTTYTFQGNVIRFFHQGEDCDTKLQHIARFLHKLQKKPVIADILLSPVRKFYPPDKVFGRSHANTGYCTSDRDRMVIYRSEEWFKVFIHEFIHYNGWETPLEGSELSLFPHSFRMYEAYCEVCARVLNCCYLSAITHIPVRCLYEIERNYSIQHMVNVLHHMDLDYGMMFDPSYDFKEDTNLFAYVVVTAILMSAKYVPPISLQVDKEVFLQTIKDHAKDKTLFHDATSRVPSVTTTMTKLNVDEFISHH